MFRNSVDPDLGRRRRASARMKRRPRRMAMRHGGGTRCERRFPRETQAGANIGKADRAPSGGRGSHVPRSRVKRSFTKAQASRPWIHAAFGPCGHGLPCGNEYCRLCRSKTIRPAQHYQHGSMTEPILFVSIPSRCSGKGGGSAGYRGYHAESSPVSSRFPGVQTDVRSSLSQNGIMAQSSASVP